MKPANKLLIAFLILALLGGVMALNYFTNPPSDEHGHDHEAENAPPQAPPATPEIPKPPPTVMNVKVFLIKPDAGNFSLQPVTRGLTREQSEDPVLESLRLLCRGAGADEALENPIPQNTKVQWVKVENGLATVSFSPEMKRNFPGGSTWEALVVTSIVETLTQFPQIDRVQILIDGKKESDLAGHIDISEPISRGERLL